MAGEPIHARFATVLLAAACGAAGACSGQDAGDHRPDIVILMADDLGWADVGFHGSEIRTPHLDRLAERGVVLDRQYVYPLCSPTRAGLLTGRAPIRYGMQYRPLRPWDTHGLPAGEVTLAELLQEAGYRTALVGKWHLGHGRADQHPNRRGFHHFYGLLTGAVDYFTHLRGDAPDWQRNGETVVEEGYATELLAGEAEGILSGGLPVGVASGRSADDPLFLLVSFNAPHTPLQAPAERVEAYAGLERPRRRTYAAMVEILDEAIGRVLRAIEESDRAENTLVLFLSDNGGARVEGASNDPLRGTKGTAWEGGIRVPAVVRWPARWPEARTAEQVISVVDWFPTLLDAAGVAMPDALGLDGANLLPILDANADRLADELFVGSLHERALDLAILDGEWKFLRRYAHGADAPEDFLFRYLIDPEEKGDLLAEHPDVAERLAGRVEAWRSLHPGGDPELILDAPATWSPPADWARTWE